MPRDDPPRYRLQIQRELNSCSPNLPLGPSITSLRKHQGYWTIEYFLLSLHSVRIAHHLSMVFKGKWDVKLSRDTHFTTRSFCMKMFFATSLLRLQNLAGSDLGLLWPERIILKEVWTILSLANGSELIRFEPTLWSPVSPLGVKVILITRAFAVRGYVSRTRSKSCISLH